MATNEELTSLLSSLSRSYSNAVESNRKIDAQIRQLEIALGYAKNAERCAEDLEREVKRFSVPSSWQKCYRDPFEHALDGSLKSGIASYENGMQDLRKGINGKIWELRLSKNHLASLISSIDGEIAKVKRDLASSDN